MQGEYHSPTFADRAFLWGVLATSWLTFGSLLFGIGWVAVWVLG
jgi:hypothetical protein